LKDEIESQKNFYKRVMKKIEIKKIKIKFEIIIYDKLRLNDEIESN
jgi:phosphoribosylamine-glycine ligase